MRPGLGERIRALTFFSQSNRPGRARVTTRVGLTLGTATPSPSVSDPPAAPAMRPRRRGSSAPGSGFAIGGHSAYLEPMFEFCFPTKAASVPDRPNWLHEVKYDGYRLRLERDSDRVHTSRRTEGTSATVSESLRGYLSSTPDCQRSARRRLTCQNHHPPPPPPTFLEFSNVRHLCALHRRPSGPVLLSVERNGGCAGALRGGQLRFGEKASVPTSRLYTSA